MVSSLISSKILKSTCFRSSEVTRQESGKSKSFYTDIECQGKHEGIVKAHSTRLQRKPFIPLTGLEYVNTTIVLSVADPSFGRAPSNHYMACADKITTPD